MSDGSPREPESPDEAGRAPEPFTADAHDPEGVAPRYGYGPPSYGNEPAPVDEPAPVVEAAPGVEPAPVHEPAAGPYPSPRPLSPPVAPRPAKRRTDLVVGLVAAGAVVVLLVVGGVVLVTRRGVGDQPAATVRTYLQALANGNAAKALAQGRRPPDTRFVSQKALQTQRRIAQIGSITVGEAAVSRSSARVRATYTFGTRRADASFSLTEVDGTWELDDTVYPIDTSKLTAVPGLTLLGVGASDVTTAYVFPGPLTWGSSNPYLTVTDRDAGEFTVSPTDGRSSSATLETSLSTRGQKAVAAAVRAHLETCAASKSLVPDHCPQAEYDYQAVDGTAAWSAPTDLGSLAYRSGSPPTRVYVSGTLTWSVTYTATDGAARKQVTAADVDGEVYGTVDLTRDPLVFTP